MIDFPSHHLSRNINEKNVQEDVETKEIKEIANEILIQLQCSISHGLIKNAMCLPCGHSIDAKYISQLKKLNCIECTAPISSAIPNYKLMGLPVLIEKLFSKLKPKLSGFNPNLDETTSVPEDERNETKIINDSLAFIQRATGHTPKIEQSGPNYWKWSAIIASTVALGAILKQPQMMTSPCPQENGGMIPINSDRLTDAQIITYTIAMFTITGMVGIFLACIAESCREGYLSKFNPRYF